MAFNPHSTIYWCALGQVRIKREAERNQHIRSTGRPGTEGAWHGSVHEKDDVCMPNAPATGSLSGCKVDLLGISAARDQKRGSPGGLYRHSFWGDTCCFIIKTLGSGKTAEPHALSSRLVSSPGPAAWVARRLTLFSAPECFRDCSVLFARFLRQLCTQSFLFF